MTEQYEYERVEIKPGDQSWVGKYIYACVPVAYSDIDYGDIRQVLSVGEESIFLINITNGKEAAWKFDSYGFYIRKPKPKKLELILKVIRDFELHRGKRPEFILVPNHIKMKLEYEIGESDLAKFPRIEKTKGIGKLQLNLKIQSIPVVTRDEIIEVEEGE